MFKKSLSFLILGALLNGCGAATDLLNQGKKAAEDGIEKTKETYNDLNQAVDSVEEAAAGLEKAKSDVEKVFE